MDLGDQIRDFQKLFSSMFWSPALVPPPFLGSSPPHRASGVSFVVLNCALEAADGVGDAASGGAACRAATVELLPRGPAAEGGGQALPALVRASDAHLSAVRSRLAVLRDRAVGLVITTARAHQGGVLSFLCLEAGIALVSGLDLDEAREVCQAARIFMLSTSGVYAY